MSRRNFILVVTLTLLLIGLLYHKQLAIHLKIILFLTEQFPQIPVKPLGLITANPEHKKVEFETSNSKVVADLFMPKSAKKRSALIVAMGIKTAEDDKPLILHFADSLARLGYVVFWPRLEVLDKGVSLPEEPETFVKAFEYLEKEPFVNSEKISYMGFSVGSSTAFIAASDPQISQKVHGLIFFGGQFDLFEYILSLASKTYLLDGERIVWNTAKDGRNHAKGLLVTKRADALVKIFDTNDLEQMKKILSQAPPVEKDTLKKYSPKEYMNKFKARLFILHDKSDTFMPYVESIKLNEALKDQVELFLITDLFDHVQPNRPINLGELAKLYGFLYQTFLFL